ncbi:class II aldolase/adducin family protein [Desulfovibrio aminophilus]|uniref:class II aldolase/adducin family protein n=1 Tax=Desulfovibrio aminophilus TaxID=81425 RepID=UPI000402F3D3|nr:class II aldolase/adducin family protein [Desulfovibrio aminophilus]
MDRILKSFAARLEAAGLAGPGDALFLGQDDAVACNEPGHPDRDVAEAALRALQASALACVRPAEPYRTILDFLLTRHPEIITPGDCETRLFLHDLPVAREFSTEAMTRALRRRKGAVLPGPRLAAPGSVGPEQAFVTVSSMCFAAFVLFFEEYLDDLRHGRATQEQHTAFAQAVPHLPKPRADRPALARGPFQDAPQTRRAMLEAGRATVKHGLVDSYFGNISYRMGGIVHISQTGSSLDHLAGCIDACPLDGSSCAGLTASSELAAHAGIYAADPTAACILHGHPRFAVILSLDCDLPDCPDRGRCHLDCPRPRRAGGAPVVPGEVGTGPRGLCHTLPPALASERTAIVLGHGLFATGRTDFNEAFALLADTENACREEYFRRVRDLGG